MTNRKKRLTLFRRLFVMAAILLASLLSLSLIVQIPIVQKFGIDHIADFLSKSMDTKVSVGKFGMNILNHIVIDDFYVENPYDAQDTLFYTDELVIRFSNPFTLLRNTLVIRKIRLNDLDLNIVTPEGRDRSSLDWILGHIQLSQQKSRGRPLNIKLREVYASDLDYASRDENINTSTSVGLGELQVIFDTISLPGKRIDINSVNVGYLDIAMQTNPERDTAERVRQTPVRDSIEWNVTVTDFHVFRSEFALRSAEVRNADASGGPVGGMDYRDLSFDEIELDICDIRFRGGRMTAALEKFTFVEKSGFELTRLFVDHIALSNQEISLAGFALNTPASYIADTIRLTYDGFEAFTDFANEVRISGHFADTRIAINDLLLTIPTLQKSNFLLQNSGKTLALSGEIDGRVNRLIGRNIYGELGRLAFEGSFRTRNLAVPGEQMLNLRIKDSRFSANGISQLLGDRSAPEQFSRLGRMRFSGNFDGFFDDFVAFGDLRSEIGSASMDMRLDFGERPEESNFSGSLALEGFDLGAWTQDQKFGVLSLNVQVRNGRGLTPESAYAELSGKVDSLGYKGYTYRDIALNGELNERYFNGQMEIDDENARIAFDGSVDTRPESPEFDFHAKVDTVSLDKLNLIEDTIRFSGNLGFTGKLLDRNTIDGSIDATDFLFQRSADQFYSLDSFRLIAEPVSDTSRRYLIRSDYINGRVTGKLSVLDVGPALTNHLYYNYPDLIPGMKPPKDTITEDINMSFNLELNEGDEWVGLVGARGLDFDTLGIEGYIDIPSDNIDIHVFSDSIRFNSNKFESVDLNLDVNAGRATVTAEIDSLFFNQFPAHSLNASMSGDGRHYDWTFAVEGLMDTLRLDLYGDLDMLDSARQRVMLDGEKSVFFDEGWVIQKSNSVTWGKQFIDFEDFVIRNEENTIDIDDINNRGLEVDVDSFDLAFINLIWDYEKLNFAGSYTMTAIVDDIFAPENINFDLLVRDFEINNDPYGIFEVTAVMATANEPLLANITMSRIGSNLNASGRYYLPIKGVDPDKHGQFSLVAELDTFPMRFLEYFLSDAIEGTEGYGIGEISLSGDTTKVELGGDLRVHDASTEVSYLGTRYYLDEEDVRLTNDRIDLSGLVLTDELGNTALVTGGLTHKYMADLGLDIVIESPRFQALKTTKADNNQFYGTGIGAVRAQFSGPVKRPDLNVDATTAEGTRIFIPVGGSTGQQRADFITFQNFDQIEEIEEPEKEEREAVRGLNLTMNMTMTPDAQVDIIFNERTRDIIRGRGSGNLQMRVTRTGEFNMYGQYEVVSGDYLFTNIAVNKPFVIQPGGIISWSGDPLDAQIDIIANYAGIRTSLSTFLQEYLVTASTATQQQARIKTDVVLQLLLKGSLGNPDINFDIRFPEVQGELRGYVDSKMSTLKQDQNALNEQAFGLLVLGTFLPTNFGANANTNLLTAGAVNTVTEFISSQLSYYLSDFIGQAVEGVDFISGIDVDVQYSAAQDYSAFVSDNNSTVEEWEVSVRNRLFNDRVIIDVGGNYVADNPIAQGAYFAGDYALEYVLTEDRRLKVRFYHRNDWTVEGPIQRTGVGLSYRREFDSFKEWLKGLDNEAKKMKKKDEEILEKNDLGQNQ